jgi:hypothetical protein
MRIVSGSIRNWMSKWPEAWVFPFTSPKTPMRRCTSRSPTIKMDLRFWEYYPKGLKALRNWTTKIKLDLELRAIESGRLKRTWEIGWLNGFRWLRSDWRNRAIAKGMKESEKSP